MNADPRIERIAVVLYPGEYAGPDERGPAIGLVAEAPVTRPARAP